MSKTETGPVRAAVALEWGDYDTPRVTAQGQGELARQIVELAHAHDIPLEEDPVLTAALTEITPGEEIPEALFAAVAEVLAFAYFLSGRNPPGYR